MVNNVSQGWIIKIENIKYPVLIVSNDTFNSVSQQIVACPILSNIAANALHIKIDTAEISGVVICEQMRLFDLSVRGYKKIGEIKMDQIANITDAVQSIFDYF
ncbi:MAG: type II toxin-antitoxin system PemK/MazF family toxin [Lachnospiraceae bacterium]|nr:type II toxin-antitoxin system PemK/MazF family toxin [Lachnospiraceae bacterium]MBR1524442.1 type II toxin-antitoxin system PemK/MazF family toxin [Lachnospiraceae bacterium]